ncbi:MAG TPA: hypothetical protein VEQ60_16335 [Longimicrobium sp.]|nr:hypothetical protein [Longimicrobium sp.]
MKHTLRSTFAALLAALALACVGGGARGGGTDARELASVLRHAPGTALDVQRALELAFVRGGGSVLVGRGQRMGALPRVAPGTQPSGIPTFAAVHAARGSYAGALIHPTLRPPFARRLAAARDGTLSARSTGVPPPTVA